MSTTTETKHLSEEHFGDICELFAGKVYAFTAVYTGPGAVFGLGIATANERGYNPVPLHFYSAETFDTASDEADRLNHKLGMDEKAAFRIIATSMRQGA